MILTNIPQLAVGAIYLSLNHQITQMIQLRDWNSLTSRHQGLRVSDPEPCSDQTSTCWLSLPYMLSIPLLFTSLLLGWILSQTLFIFRFDLYDDVHSQDVDLGRYAIGYSTVALLFSLAFGLAILVVSVALGFRKCCPGMVLGSSNSLVIAAACHPPENDTHPATKSVRWRAVTITDGHQVRQRCTITSRRVEDPVTGEWYY